MTVRCLLGGGSRSSTGDGDGDGDGDAPKAIESSTARNARTQACECETAGGSGGDVALWRSRSGRVRSQTVRCGIGSPAARNERRQRSVLACGGYMVWAGRTCGRPGGCVSKDWVQTEQWQRQRQRLSIDGCGRRRRQQS